MLNRNQIELIECPRDAMQGIEKFIPTKKKVEYLNALLKVGFDVLDFGSFVSAKTVPQMVDTKDVIPQLDLTSTNTKLLAIIANTRGAEDAVKYDEITYLGFPFSISEIFLERNINSTIMQSLLKVEEIQNLCIRNDKELVVYISMAFGNPYNEEYSTDIAIKWVDKLARLGIKTIAMADTVGVARPEDIASIFERLIPEFKNVNIGAHFHSTADKWEEKFATAYLSGCFRFDSAIRGIGGCPMAEDKLVGNIATENIISWCEEHNIPLKIDKTSFELAEKIAYELFE